VDLLRGFAREHLIVGAEQAAVIGDRFGDTTSGY